MSVLPVGQGSTGYDVGDIANSLRFRGAQYLSRTFGTPTNNKIYTISTWVKNSYTSAVLPTIISPTGGGFLALGDATTPGKLRFNDGVGCDLIANNLYRDPSSHTHFIVAVDTTQVTASDRVKIYANNVQITSFSTSVYMAQNAAQNWNSAVVHNIGRRADAAHYFDGYLSRVCFVDGAALTPDSFGYFNTQTNSWVTKTQAQVKAVVDAGGTNSFMLDFDDASTVAALGTDKSSKSNTWTVNGHSLTAGTTYDHMLDTPSNNFATLSPIDKNASAVIAWGNLNGGNSPAVWRSIRCTQGMYSGAYYFEGSFDTLGGSNYGVLGVMTAASSLADGLYVGVEASSYGVVATNTSHSSYNNSTMTNHTSSTNTSSTIFQVAIDIAAGKLWLGRENAWLGGGSPSAGTSPTYTFTAGTMFFPATSYYASSGPINLGQRPFQTGATYYPAAGGYFKYAPPTGFKALCTANLPDPAIANPSEHFDVVTYAGNSGVNGYSSLAFGPDLLWSKKRSDISYHYLIDELRGHQNTLYSNATDAEATIVTTTVSLDTNGVSYNGPESGLNTTGNTYVNWLWKANGAGVPNGAGDIPSTVSANQQAGFSIVTYTGTGANATVGHGLGKVPSMIFVKDRDTATGGAVFHNKLTSQSYYLKLFQTTTGTDAQASDSTVWQASGMTTAVFTVGTSTRSNASAKKMVAYCFAEIEGYSKFGSYTGNGLADGPFVYCGFRPRYVLIKNASAGSTNWVILDAARIGHNPSNFQLYPNLANSDGGGVAMDLTSNGFKLRIGATGDYNTVDTFIFAAFAEAPFKFANSR